MISSIRNNLWQNVKNIPGWYSNQRIIVFAVDDYGNVRLANKEAREKMNLAGMKVFNRFDAYDSLETKEDLEMLYETLNSVKDKNNNPAVFTAYAVPCNIDFEKIQSNGFNKYHYELLTETFQKLSANNEKAYGRAWDLWKEGIKKGLMAPQFHGREHLNLKVFEEKLEIKNEELLTALRNRSYTSISNSGYPTISVTASYDFTNIQELDSFKQNIKEGIEKFKSVFGLQPFIFTPPAYSIHNSLFASLADAGIKFIDLAMVQKEHQGNGKYKMRFNYTGKQKSGLTHIVRNVVFEPTIKNGFDWVSYSMKQIEAAFRWNRPANISSHRVNFCGHIDPSNRKKGLTALKALLKKIIVKWPDVEFMSTSDLGKLIIQSKS